MNRRKGVNDHGMPRGRPQMLERARQFRRPLTPMEARLWAHLRDRRCGGYKFRRQVPVSQFIADFVCVEARLIVEVDGAIYDTMVERDAARDAVLSAQGYQTLRVTNAQVQDELGGVVERIRLCCIERTKKP